ncbi:MAG TPA: WYL domain-containing protein [Propionibacteriaceae bacterium]|nr:WYL domain-containing protein [Propionibacteriaceae bacterium]
MRADRLVATLLLLQARGQLRAADLARELEVSVATARRDLEALSSAGIPVYAQPGRGGGWALLGGARTDLTGLTAAETQALFLLAGPASSGSPALASALRKLVRALPSTFRTDAESAAAAVVLDPASWGEREPGRPDLVAALQRAVVSRRQVRLDYRTRSGEQIQRVVDPWGLVDKAGLWYLIAGTASGQRTFRVDRISAAALTENPAERPDDFDLAESWRQVVEEVEEQRSLTTAIVVVETRWLFALRGQFGRHFEVLSEVEDKTTVRLAAPTPLMIAQPLAGWGRMIQVVESDAVRAELARLGAELIERNAPGG